MTLSLRVIGAAALLMLLAGCVPYFPYNTDEACWTYVGEATDEENACPEGTFPGDWTSTEWTDNGDGTWTFTGSLTCTDETSGEVTTSVTVSDVWRFTGDSLEACGADLGGVPAAASTVPYGIWAAAVCEPFDGFSANGSLTLGSDAPAGTPLYASASASGPWQPLEINGPAYVLTRTQLEGIATGVGASDVDSVYVKAGAASRGNSIGALTADRQPQMDALCGG